ncbi:MAG TPA: multicopper oxidase domain-containing protein [Candidatus Eisenbacteria bacterium]|nr:multicopper oxidase domain-containing protein [Candidatus Eisenbacteria bacterium]
METRLWTPVTARPRCTRPGLAGPILLALLLGLFVPVSNAAVVDLNPVMDNMMVQENVGNSNGAGSWLIAGNNNQGASGQPRRALIRFDLSGIPSTAVITAVTLTMTNDRGKAGTQAIALHRVTAEWGEGTSNSNSDPGKGAPATLNDATWAHRLYPSPTWTTPGGDFVAVASATTPVGNSAAYSWTSSQLVADVQQWVTTPSSNFGWILIGNETVKATARRFHGRSGTTPPVLRVTYTTGTVTGACCTGSSCEELTPAQCAAAAGTYHGDGTVCSPNPCVTPTGACCMTNGTCAVHTAAGCATAGGTYQGDNTACSPNPCPVVLTPYLDPLPIPALATPTSGTAGGVASYTMSVREVSQQLHSQLPPTRVWGYGSTATGATYPGPTILASTGNPVTVTWVNDLRDAQGNLRTTHYLPVDLCMKGPDMEGPTARIVTHLHGGHVPPESDGYPENTLLPGQQTTYVYPNNQPAGTLWYHDHAMGITRLNVIMGMAGYYLLTDATETALGLPSGQYEMGLAIQDRTFNSDGSFRYPAVWDEHFFGDKILVNGKVWPYLNVKKGKYRFRMLNGSTSRVYTLNLSNGAPFWVIGNELGLLPKPLHRTSITITPGERLDVVIDFQPYTNGTQILLQNSAPAPYPGTPGVGVIPEVMKFVVVNGGGTHTAPLPATLRPFTPIPESEAARTRTLELFKVPDECTGQRWSINGLRFADITEFPGLGTAEIWSWVNRSGYIHPMHMHLVAFHVLDRQPFVIVDGAIQTTGPRVAPDSADAGWKDTTPVRPLEIVRVIARFEDYLGKYPYHCHILEHEEHEMMRQFQVVQPTGVGPVATAPGVELRQNFPNPTTGVTRFAFEIPAAARVKLVIEDVAGRRIATLIDQKLTAGGHEVLWDGLVAGREAAAGVYFYRLVVDGKPSTARRLVVK